MLLYLFSVWSFQIVTCLCFSDHDIPQNNLLTDEKTDIQTFPELLLLVEQLQAEAIEDRAKIAEIETEQRAKISSLEDAATKDRAKIEELGYTVKILQQKIIDEKAECTYTSKTNVEDNETINNRSNTADPVHEISLHSQSTISKNKQKRTTVGNGVAFYASLSQTIDSPTPGHDIRYDHTITNIGNGYNSNTGVFTCPQTGHYYITWSFRIERHWGSAVLYRNGYSVGTATTGDDKYFNEEGFGNVIIYLLKGDTLIVRANVQNFPDGGQPDILTPASFCGFKLWI